MVMGNKPVDQNETPLAPMAEENEKDAIHIDTPSTTQKEAAPPPFQKWMNSFQVQHRGARTIVERHVDGWEDWDVQEPQEPQEAQQTRENQENQETILFPDSLAFECSSQHSSLLGTVRTASLSVISRSRSRMAGTFSSDVRASGESDTSARPTSIDYADEAADNRARNRRQVLIELVATETDYVAGLKALEGVFSILDIRAQIQKNISRLYVLHDEFLALLRTITPSSSKIPTDIPGTGTLSRLATHDIPGLKNLTARSVQRHNFRASVNGYLKADAKECLDVARAIENLSTFFSEYDEFCTNYDLLSEDVAMVRRSVSDWAKLDKGIEALSKSVSSIESRNNEDNKAMSLNDLMIKPIQRLCKYSLLLQDLLKNVPISDCPTSHGGIRDIMESLRALITQINSSTGNPVKKDFIQKTIRLQEKIDLSDSLPLRDIYKELGPMSLCGVLHVTYQAQNGPDGEFMVCALFSCYILFARRSGESNRLSVVACIHTADMKTDTQRNGRGLDCYQSLFTWKLLFQDQKQSCEFLLSASCAAEERQWKMETLKASAALTAMYAKQGTGRVTRRYSFNTLQLMQLDRVHYTVTSMSRRQSMESGVTTRRSHIQPIAIKKTHKPRKRVTIQEVTGEITESIFREPESELERPKTLVSHNLLIVTGKRSSRIDLEKMIADIYTKEVLPYPGMTLGRSDLFDRQTIMRRLSFRARKQSSTISVSISKPALTDSRPSARYNGGEDTIIESHDGCADHRGSVEEPKMSTCLRRSMTARMSRKSIGALSFSSRGEKGRQETESVAPIGPVPLTRKKWPRNLFCGFSKKKD